MKNKYLNKLEFNKILENLENYAITSLGKEICKNLTPRSSKEEVYNLIQETTEASILLIRKSAPPLAPINDISISLKILKSNGVLSIDNLLELAKLLKISRELKKYSRF